MDLSIEKHALLPEAPDGQSCALTATSPGTSDDASSRDLYWGYWVLFVFSFYSALQGFCWSLPGTVATTLLAVYSHMTGSTIQLLVNWGSITYLPIAFPCAYAMHRKYGFRLTTIASIALLVAAAVARCGAQADDEVSVALWHVSAILTGIAGPVANAAPSQLAELWFPPAKRAFAMALALESNMLGCALAFVVAPAMLPDPSAPRAESLAGLNLVYGVTLALCAACLACCACFPAEPSRAPSRSARSEADAAALASLRTAVAGFKSLACNRQWGVVAAAYAVSVGFLSAWGGVLVLNLALAGIPQSGAGYIGFASTIVGFAAGLVVGRIADASRRLRPLLLGLMVVNAAALVAFSTIVLLPEGARPAPPTASLALIWVAALVSGAASNGALPLYFELCVEAAFPVPSSIVIMAATALYNAASIALLSVPVASAPDAFNWVCTGGCIAVTLLVAGCFREQARRYDFDMGGSVGISEEEDGVALGLPAPAATAAGVDVARTAEVRQ